MRVNNFARRAYRRIQAAGLKTLLDIGCGTGQDSIYFSSKGMSVTALDLASSSLERLNKREKRITCLTQDICHLNFPEASFEVIYAHLSLQYFDDNQTHEIFGDIYKILKKGGLFFVKCKSTSDRLYGKVKSRTETSLSRDIYAISFAGLHGRGMPTLPNPEPAQDLLQIWKGPFFLSIEAVATK